VANDKYNGYALTKRIFEFAAEEKECTYQHIALFLWIVEKCNRLGWKDEFQLPTEEAMHVLSFGNKNTFLNALQKLIDWSFIKVTQDSINQFQARYIKICRSENEPAQDTAEERQRPSIDHGGGVTPDPKDKPIKPIKPLKHIPTEIEFLDEGKKIFKAKYSEYEFSLKAKYEAWVNDGWIDGYGKEIKNWKTKLKNSVPHLKPFNSTNCDVKPKTNNLQKTLIENG
jgi:hypothetical protein